MDQLSSWYSINIAVTRSSHYSDVYNGRDCVSILFAPLFIHAQIKENIKAPRHWHLCWEVTGSPMNSPHRGPVTRKMFSFDDVIVLLRCQMTTVRYICDNFFVGQMLNECSPVTTIYLSHFITWARRHQMRENVTYIPSSLISWNIWDLIKKMEINEGPFQYKGAALPV